MEKNEKKLIEHSAWFQYHKNKVPTLNLLDFVLEKYLKRDSLLDGNVLAKFNPDFDPNYSIFHVYSPDSLKYIDLDSYHLLLHKNRKGQLVSEGFDVDQEVNLINLEEKTVKRLCFHGTSSEIEDVLWKGASIIYLLGYIENQLFIERIDLNTFEYWLYSSKELEEIDQKYSKEERLKQVRFEIK